MDFDDDKEPDITADKKTKAGSMDDFDMDDEGSSTPKPVLPQTRGTGQDYLFVIIALI